MKLQEALPELVADIEGVLVRLGRGAIADQVREASLVSWAFDDFVQATYLRLSPEAPDIPGGAATIVLYDDIGVNIDLDDDGRVIGLEVVGYEDILARLAPMK